ncbi:MAG: hypothetical protein LBD88_00685 [Candidatus Peribacteria bacterium]|jgi:hypothetical protein|nr:hypothetical protein [Candidatus Peribacteria bacterium]
MSTIDTLDNTQNTPDNILTQEKPSWYSKLSPEKQKEYDSIIDKTSKLEGERKNIIENRSIFFRQIDNVI